MAGSWLAEVGLLGEDQFSLSGYVETVFHAAMKNAHLARVAEKSGAVDDPRRACVRAIGSRRRARVGGRTWDFLIHRRHFN